MTASARAPGSRKSTGRPLPVGRTLTEAKKSRTTTGMTIVTRTFSPRRAVSRSSIAGLGAGSPRRAEAGRLIGRPRRGGRVIRGRIVAGRRAPPPATRRPARGRRPRGCRPLVRSSTIEPIRASRHQAASAATSAASGSDAVESVAARRRHRARRVAPGRTAASAPPERRRARPRPAAGRAGTAAEASPRRCSSAGVPDGDDPAAVEDADPVGQPLDVGQVVARQQDRGALVAQVRDDRPGRGAGLRVHPGGRLVEDHDLGPADERERQPEPLPLAARQAPVARPRDGAQPDEVEQLVGVARVVVEPAVLAEGLARLGARVDAAALEHQPDPRPERRSARRRIDARGRGPSRRRRAGSPRRSRPSSSCPRRSVRAARRARRRRPSARRRRGPSARRSA